MSVRYKDTYCHEYTKIKETRESNRPHEKPHDTNRPHESIKPDLINHEYKLIDCPTPNFYQLFEERVLARRNSKGLDRSGYKNALHKRVRLLKSRLKDLVS